MRKLQKGEAIADAASDVGRIVPDNYNRGKVAEKFLESKYGGVSQSFKDGDLWRHVDNFDILTKTARESKVGRVSATSFTKAQLQKDFDLLMSGKVNTVEWLFSTSSKTGKGGFTDGFKKVVHDLNNKLKAAGKNEIKLTITGQNF